MILDHLCDIRFDSEKFLLPNTHTLTSLRLGLRALAEGVRAAELVELEELKAKFPVDVQITASLNWSPRRHLVANHFDWFSVSLVNYLRLVKLVGLVNERQWTELEQLKREGRLIVSQCHAYASRVAPEAYMWRDKIGAHRAIHSPSNSETLSMLISSMTISIGFGAGRYRTPGATVSQPGVSDALPTKPWSVTETYEKLAPRLWPDSRLPSDFSSVSTQVVHVMEDRRKRERAE